MIQEHLPQEENADTGGPTNREKGANMPMESSPMESLPKIFNPITQVNELSSPSLDAQHTNKILAPENVRNHSKEFEVDEDNVNDSDSENTDYSDCDDTNTNEMTLSIDESDQKRFIYMRENESAISKTRTESMTIPKKTVHMPNGMQTTLDLSDVFELYDQDGNSVAEEMKNRMQIGYGNVRLLFKIESFSFVSTNHWLGYRS